MPTMSQVLGEIYVEQQAVLLRYAQRSFPRLDQGRHEDALSMAFLDALCRPGIARIWREARSPEEARRSLRRIFPFIVWRHLRNDWRRKDTQSLSASAHLPEPSSTQASPEQELMAIHAVQECARQDDQVLLTVLYDACRQSEPLRQEIEAVIAEVCEQSPWVQPALQAYIHSAGTMTKTELGERFGGPRKQARCILSRKIQRLEQRLCAHAPIRAHLGLA